MKAIGALMLVALIGAVLVYVSMTKTEDVPYWKSERVVVLEEGVPTSVLMKDSQSSTVAPSITSSMERLSAQALHEQELSCWQFNNLQSTQLVALEQWMRAYGLHEKVQLKDHFEPTRYIVYLGPYSTSVAVRGLLQQFHDQGFRTARPILSGALSYGIELKSFGSQQAAQQYLQSGNLPAVDGFKVAKRLGGPTETTDVLFLNVTDREQKLLEHYAGQRDLNLMQCQEVSPEYLP